MSKEKFSLETNEDKFSLEKLLLYRSLKAQVKYHKYLYYELLKPEISDFDYDMLEKKFDQLAECMGLEGSWVGYNPEK